MNDWVYENINDAVYKSGFATKQEIYEKEVTNLFDYLEKIEKVLKDNKQEQISKYLLGDKLTEANVRLFTTIIRFDQVYVQHFNCNIGLICSDFPYLHDWVRDIYWNCPLVKDIVSFDHIKLRYTKSHPGINPHHNTPLGPVPHILPLGSNYMTLSY
jgi:putative glutathione S-transferase